jgi:hypothetical protein
MEEEEEEKRKRGEEEGVIKGGEGWQRVETRGRGDRCQWREASGKSSVCTRGPKAGKGREARDCIEGK